MIKKLIHIALDFLFPKRCIRCGRENELICGECMERIECFESSNTKSTRIAADYRDETIKKAIWMLKYKGIRQMSDPLSQLILKCFRDRLKPKSGKTIVVPVPLSEKRLKERGFNQSELIAEKISKELNIPIITGELLKIKETPSQVDLKNIQDRLKNVRGSMAVKNKETLRDKEVILVDDVITTGATLDEAKRALRGAGVKKIISLVVAKSKM
ncbi:MAG: ComF family protein [Patescibacteria group bacterium]